MNDSTTPKPSDIQWLTWVRKIKAIAQNGLAYCQSPFDHERYLALQELAAEIAASYSMHEHQELCALFTSEEGYATPKLDVRGVVFQKDKILLVKEIADGLWTLPGGFADINESPGESVVREIYEESGYETRVVKLLALLDMQKHTHPAQLHHIFKSFFLCELIGGKPSTSIETSAVDFFAEDAIPDLSLPRVTPDQIKRLFEHHRRPYLPTDFD